MRRYNFICVNYNGSNFTKTLLESLEKIKVPDGESVRFVVVDNSSSEQDKSELLKLSSTVIEVKLIENSSNIGYFPALNVGIKFSKTSNEDVIIVGNNDLTYDEFFILKLKASCFPDDVLVLCPDVKTLDGVHQNPLSMQRIGKFDLFLEHLYYSNYYVSRLMINVKKMFMSAFFRTVKSRNHLNVSETTEPVPIVRGIGACYVLTDSFFKCYDALDDRVFMWGEEALLANQVRKANGLILFVPALKVEHYESGSVKKLLTRQKYEMVRKSFRVYKEYL